MSDWADKKARELCYRGWHEAAAQELDVAAALREAYERGRDAEGAWRYPHMCRDGHAEVGHRTEDEMCPACQEYERGRQEERWACWHAVDAIAAEAYLCIVSHSVSHPCAQECADALNARGPMRKPEEE